jgi:hypothetical protein
MTNRVTLASTVRLYIDEKDADNSHFTDTEIYGFLNQAIRFIGTDLEWPLQTAEATSIEDQAVYTLPDDFVSLLDVYFDDNQLLVIERADLAGLDTSWQTRDSGSPYYAYKSDNAKFGVWPKPDADHASKTIQIQYIKVPPDLSDDTTAPDLHVALTDCLPFYAAYLCEKSMGNKVTAQQHLTDYEYHRKKLQSKVQGFSQNNMSFKWSDTRMY